MVQLITLVIHICGFGLFVTIIVAGLMLTRQYKKAPDLQTKAVLIKALRPIGLLGPVAILIMLVTGIGNMQAIGVGPLDLGWLSAKLAVFAVAVVTGVISGVLARKRGMLLGQMVAGKAPEHAAEMLAGYDKRLDIFYIVMPLLLLIILCLTVYGRLGMQ